ncbi:MAG: glycosyltransferase family 2 protein [Ruminococcus sp.]|nr:glycosyltransferase family 2 protein [Ruminococcus sp.]
MDLISVIIPIYNVEPYLERCVESVRNQTYSNLEIILVDDQSPDDCPQMCDEYAQKDSRIKVIHKKNGGLGYARNSGLELINGKYVTFIDSDDWISETHIENLYNAVDRTNSDVAIGGHTSVCADGEKRVYTSNLEYRTYENEDLKENVLFAMLGSDLSLEYDVQISCSCCMNLYRTDVILKNNLKFNSEREAISEDMVFNLDFFNYCQKVVSVDETGYFYFTNPKSISRRYEPKGFDRTLKFYTEINKRVEKYGFRSGIGYRFDRTFLMMIRVHIKHLVASDLPKKKKIEQIRKILNDKMVVDVLVSYPINAYTGSIRIFTKLMCGKKVHIVYTFTKLRVLADNMKLTRNALKLIGIGKHR